MAQSWKFTPGTANLADALRPGLVRALRETADEIAARAADTAPYATGRLAHSVTTAVDPGRMIAGIGFTDSKAVAAHEEMHAHLDSGKRPKFLELAMHEHGDALVAKADVELRRVFK